MSLIVKDSIVIRNIYYMMAYAFRALELQEYKKLAMEEFDNADDLLAAILIIGMSTQIKRGLERGYHECKEDLGGVRGRIDFLATTRHRLEGRALARCSFDAFDEDTYKNRILKKTANILITCPNVKDKRRRDLKRCLLSLKNVTDIDANHVEWGKLHYDRNNSGYLLLMYVCNLVLNDNILADKEGSGRVASFLSGQELHALFERFVLEYFRKHHQNSFSANAKIIAQEFDRPTFLPSLNTDVTLEGSNGTLIIDCKFYKSILNNYYDHEILSSENINQLHMYVSSEAWNTGNHVEGMLLYAKTCEENIKPTDWEIAGFSYHFRFLDLDCEFSQIAAQLDVIAEMVKAS